MAEQPELDLPLVESPVPRAATAKRTIAFAGFTRTQIMGGVLLVGAIVWGMWVTRVLTAPKQDHIVSARLSTLVGDYVEAQRFSGSPPDRVRAEMQAFMSSLDKELQRRSQAGQVVLVGEAVLTRNVPDITDSLKRAVLASGVPEPKRLSAEELQRIQTLSAAQAASTTAHQTPVPTIGPMPVMPATDRLAPAATPNADPQMPSAVPGASVSTFGGPDGNRAQ